MTKEDFQRALNHWRNFPREDKVSPAELMFGRKQNTKLLTLPSQMTQVDRATAIKNKDELAKKHTEYFNKTAKPLSVFEPGETVRVKSHISDKWDQMAKIISRRDDNLSYVIEMQGCLLYTSPSPRDS